MIAAILAGALASNMQEEELFFVRMNFKEGEVVKFHSEYKDEVVSELDNKKSVFAVTTRSETTYTIDKILKGGHANFTLRVLKSESERVRDGKATVAKGELGSMTGVLSPEFAAKELGDWTPSEGQELDAEPVTQVEMSSIILDELHGAIPTELPKRNFAEGDRWTIPIKNSMFTHDSQWVVRSFGATSIDGRPVFQFEWSFDGRFDMDIADLDVDGYVGELPQLRLTAAPTIRFIRSVDKASGWMVRETGSIAFDASIELVGLKSEQQAKSTWTAQRVMP